MEKSDLQRFRNECVAAHNFYRAAHGTPPICWSTRLAESAQVWAEQLASTTGSLRYSSAKDVGENLACLWGSELNGQKITRIWYEEGQHFDYNKPRVSSRTRSFCQVVWEATRELGAGAAVTKHGKQIVVARYFPPVNKKDVARNVKKARSTRDNEQPLAYDTRWSRLYLGLKEFHEECLSVHNEYRIRHGAAPLHWSAELAWEAQQWAENLARTGELRHNVDDTVGENLAGMAGGELSGREAVDMWYEEIESYDFENHGYSEDTSNFTQVVWVASENLGVGRAIDGDLCVVVAFYEPPGNMEGSFGDNVLRMGSKIRQRKSKEPKGFIPPSPDLDGFRLECLVTHNYFRARHGSPPLVLSSTLTDEAQYWAERLLVTGASEGLDNSRIGISVAVLENRHVSGIKVSELWYKQILSYDFDSPGFSSETLDFSQLVWLSSRKLGVGKATGAEGVTVVVARYEPVGNIDGLFVHNVRRRGHERGSCEPMIFHVEYKYRVRADSKSTNSFLSWEHEDAPTLELEGDVTKASDLDQFDENKNIVHRADEQESASSLTVTDAFTRLVWIDPNSPTLQRKGVAAEKTEQDVDHDDADDEEEDGDEMEEDLDEEDAKTAYEQDNGTESEDLKCVSEEPLAHTEEAELEQADLFSDPEDDLYQHVCEMRRSLSLDSEGTEPEVQKGNVLSKVAFFETFQRSFEAQSPSNSESSFRRSLIQDDLEELASRPKRQAFQEEAEQEPVIQGGEEEEEHECQLEFDDLFPAHREGNEAEEHVAEDILEVDGDEDESLVSVSDTEDVLEFTGYDTRPEGLQDYELEDSYCVSHEFTEEEPSNLEIFDFSDEEASHQYADLTEDQPRSSTRRVFAPISLGTPTEFHKTEHFKSCEDEPPDLMKDTPDNYNEEMSQTSEAEVEEPQTCFTRTLDPDQCFMTTKEKDVDIRMKEIISKIELVPVEDSTEDTNELSDFDETIEGKLLQNVFNNRKGQKRQEERTPIEEICEAFHKNNVESEIDFDQLFARLERDGTDSEEEDAIPQSSREIGKRESPDTFRVVLRDHESERSAGMERISSDVGLESTEQLAESELEEKEFTPDIFLTYECQTSIAIDDNEPIPENIKAVKRDHKPESSMDLEELQVKMEGPTEDETSQNQVSEDREASREEETCEIVLRDHHQKRAKFLDEIGLLPVSSDDIHSVDEPVEPLPYDQAPMSRVSELPEVTEDITADVRRDVRCEINFEELFRRFDEDNASLPNETVDTHPFDVQDSFGAPREEDACEPVFRNYELERTRLLEERALQLELVTASPDVNHSFNEPLEPLPYDRTPTSSTVSHLPEVSEDIGAEVRKDVRSEINFEEMFRCLEEEDTKIADELADRQRFEETETTVIAKPSRASLYLEEDTMVDEGAHCAPSSVEHICHESENDIPAEEVTEVEQVDTKRPASSYTEENTVVEEVTAESPSSPKHIAAEGVNIERIEVADEIEESKEEKSAFLVADERQVVTKVNTEFVSLQHVAGEAENTEMFEEVNEERLSDGDNRASLYMEEEQLIQEMTPEVSSSPTHLANEFENVDQLEEKTEEIKQRGEENRASMYLEENIVDSVTLQQASLDPLHIAGETLNVDPTTQREELEQCEYEKRASLYSEEVVSLAEVTSDTPSSPKHIACESVNTELVEKAEREEEPIVEENRASLYWEDDVLVDDIKSDAPSSPKHIASEIVNPEFTEDVKEQTEDEQQASLFMEEETIVSYVTTNIRSSPLHISSEGANGESVEEIFEEEFVEVEKRASLFLEEDSVVNEVVPDTPSSPKHIAGESKNEELFEQIDEEPTEDSKRASLFLEETATLDEVTVETHSSPKHIALESRNIESFEEVDEKPTEESKRVSLFLEEAPLVDEVTTGTPSSPKHVAGESHSVEPFEETDEQPTEETNRASVFLEEVVTVDVVTIDAPSFSKHLAGESVNIDTSEEVAAMPEDENKRASVFLEEESFVDVVTTSTPSVPIHIAGEVLNMQEVESIHEEKSIPDEEHAQEFEESDSEVRYGCVSLQPPAQNSHVAGEISNSDLLEVTDEDESPESDYGEHFQEFEGIHGTETFVKPPQTAHVAGEIRNGDDHDEALEEVIQLEESLAYEENQGMVTTIELSETPEPPFYVAGELSNEEPREESSEEEKPEVEAFAEEFEEAEVQASTVVLKSPQSLLSIAAAALEQNIDAAQQDATEESTTEIDIDQQYSDGEHAGVKMVVTSNVHLGHKFDNSKQREETVEMTTEHSPALYEEAEPTDVTGTDVDIEVPVILVNIAAEISENEEDNIVFVEDERQEDHEIELERYEDQEERVLSYPTKEEPVSQAHVAAEICVSEFLLEEDETNEQREFVEPFEESEEGSELLSECSSSPLHVSSELKDFQDYETINEEYGTEMYHAITYEEGDYVSKKTISKGLPSLFITEELTPQEIFEENILNEQSVVRETVEEISEVEDPLQKSLVISQPPLQTAAELSDSDFNDGVEEEDDLSEREFAEEFVDMEAINGQLRDSLEESISVASEILSTSHPQIAVEEDELLEETDDVKKVEIQEPVVSLEQSTRDTSPVVLAAVDERVVHKQEKILEEVWEVEVKESGQYVETLEEKLEASQTQKCTAVSEKEQRSVDIESSFQVFESEERFSVSQTRRGESVFVDEQGRQMEISHEMEEKVEVFSTRTVSHVSSTTSHVAREFTSEGSQYQFEHNGTCMSHHLESNDQLSESVLDKEAKDQESEKFEKQLSEEETEVRLLKSEVMEYRAAERQAPLVNPSVTVERETIFMKTMVVQSAAKEDQEQVLMREDRVTAMLKEDEASLEEESVGEQLEEEIDIMRMDEALSEEEFRGEGPENTDRAQSRSSKADSVGEIEKDEEQDDTKVHEGDESKSLYEEEVEICEVEPFYEEKLEVKRERREVVETSHKTDESVVETPSFEEEVEVTAVAGSEEPVVENLEPIEATEIRTQPAVYEEELEVSAFPKEDDSADEEYTEEDKPVDQSAVFEEELEISAFSPQEEPVEEQHIEEDKSVDHSAVFEEELEVSTFTGQEESVDEQPSEGAKPGDHSAVFEEELEVSGYSIHDKPTEEQHTKDEDHEMVAGEDKEPKPADDEETAEITDEEESIEPVETTQTRRQPLDLSQVDLYDEEESATATRYYVELSSTESLEPPYEEVEEDETSYIEKYVRQGEPLEENLEEFILVRYGDEFESSGEEDISDHREIYVIPEEENDVENNNVVEAAKDDDFKAEEPLAESFYEEGFENMGLEEIRESPEFDIDDSDELDEEEQRQLEEYERLESFVILEEKLSQVESDDDENIDLQGEEGDENVFHSDVHSSSEETLHEDELGETMTASSIRKAAECKEGETSQGDDCTQVEDKGSDELQEACEKFSSSDEGELRPQEEFSESKVAEQASSDEGTDKTLPKQDTEDESLPEDSTDKKEDSESSKTKDDRMEQSLSSDSSGEQSMSSEGSLSSTHSVDLEGLDNFEQDCLLQHNLYRRQHRVKPLKWSEELAEGAKRWAEHLASINSLENFEGKEVGENLTSVHGSELNGTEAADLWYKEETDYNFEVPAFNAKCGRFTQVVWASSREFGVARGVAGDGTQYVVARYKPAGNIVGEFKENVKPPRDPSSRLKRRRSSARRRSKSGAPSTPAEKEKFKTECVISHNYYRTFHNAPALRWSPLLAAEAQNYAERLAKTDSLTHSGQKDRGENLAYTWDTPLSARGAIDMWYDEVQDYDFESPGYTSDTGHFTQLVWVGTEEFGMGMAVAADGRNIVVGRYFPPGNILGKFKDNVRPREIEGIP